MLNQKVKLMTHNTGCRAAGATGNRAGAQHVLSVLLAMCAAIVLAAGLSVVYFTAPKAEAQNCVITNPQSFTGKVIAVGPTGTNPSHEVDLTFPQAAYVNKVTVTSSRTNLGNESTGKWQITLGGRTYTSGDGVQVSYTTKKAGPVVFEFDTPVKVGANSSGVAIITLWGQSGQASNYSMTYTGSVNDPCPPPSPTTSQQPTPATTVPTVDTSQPEPTSAEPAPDTSVPSTSAQPEPTPTSQPKPTTTTPVPTTSNPGSASGAPTNEPTSTAPTTSVDPKAGTGEAPSTDRGLRSGEIGVRVRAAAFRTDSSQYSKGIKFRVWTAQDFYNSNGTYDYRKTQDKGPVAPINESWATCTTNANGECTIYFPANRRRDTYFILQENEYPGTFHIGKYNWGEYGNFDNRTNASVPGWVNIRNNDSTFEVVDITDGRLTTNAYWRPLWSSAQSLDNPPMEKVRKCQASGGPKIAMVLDRTASIRAADGETDYRNAVYGPNGFLESLVGTGASVAFFPFADHSLASGTMTTPVSVDTNLAQAKENASAALKTSGALTNWESGFEAVRDSGQIFDEVIFVTDGDANKWFAGGREQSVNIDGSVPGIEAGIYAANELKAKGMRVVSIGVASAKNYQYWNGSGQMKSVSGPQYGVDYFGTDWSRLAGTLRAAASEVTCQIEFEVNKQVVSSDGSTLLADQSAAEGWNMSLNVSGIPDPQADIMTGTEKPPFGYLSGDANQVINSSTASVSKATHGTPASVHWNLTQYADPNKSNTTAVIGEDVNSKSGYEFVPGKSTYEVQDARTGKRRSGGTLQSESQTINGLKPGDRVVVNMVNRVVPQISLQKDLPNGRKKDGDQFELSISEVTGYQGSAYVDSVLGSAAVTQGSGNGLQKTSNGKTLQAGPFKLEPNTKYLLRENAAAGANLEDYNTELKCTGATASPVPDARRGGSGRVWEVSTGAAVNDNITCTFANKPVLRTSISWKKIDNENKPLACSQWMLTRTKDENGNEVRDQRWAVNDNASGCTYDNTGLSVKEDSDTTAGSFKVVDLPLGTYVIEEVRAPNGYGVNNQRKSATIELTAAKASAGVTITDPFVNYPDVTTPGTLPRTGGVGIGTTAGIAGMIVALGCVMLRRRNA